MGEFCQQRRNGWNGWEMHRLSFLAYENLGYHNCFHISFYIFNAARSTTFVWQKRKALIFRLCRWNMNSKGYDFFPLNQRIWCHSLAAISSFNVQLIVTVWKTRCDKNVLDEEKIKIIYNTIQTQHKGRTNVTTVSWQRIPAYLWLYFNISRVQSDTIGNYRFEISLHSFPHCRLQTYKTHVLSAYGGHKDACESPHSWNITLFI